MDSVAHWSLNGDSVTSLHGEGKGHCPIQGHSRLRGKETEREMYCDLWIYRVIQLIGCMEEEWESKAYLRFVVKPPVIGDCPYIAGAQHGCEVHCFVLDDHWRSRELDLLKLTFREKTQKP